MKSTITLAMLCMITAAKTQVLTGDASGNSALLYHGVGLGLKIDNKTPAVTFNFNNYMDEKLKNWDKGLVWGVNATTVTDNGLGNIFSSGDVTAFKGGVIIGRIFKGPNLSRRFKERFAVQKEGKLVNKANTNDEEITIRDFIGNQNFAKKNAALINEARGYWQNRKTIFLDAGYQTNIFKTFTAADPANLGESFNEKTFRGYHFYLGANVQYNTWGFGLKGGLRYSNNLAALGNRDFFLQSHYAGTNGDVLIKQKKITAYTGTYHQLLSFPVMADVIVFLPATDSVEIALNSYFRTYATSDKAKLASSTDIGIAASLFKKQRSDFVGGLYLEFPDINNSLAKMDPGATLRPLHKRLTFGIMAKFSFGSIFSYD